MRKPSNINFLRRSYLSKPYFFSVTVQKTSWQFSMSQKDLILTFQSLRRYHQPYYSNFKVVLALRMFTSLKKKRVNHGKVRRSRQKSRSSRSEVFCEKGVLKNFTKFRGKHLWHRCFPVNFVKFLRTPFL